MVFVIKYYIILMYLKINNHIVLNLYELKIII
jgi:hypothetical protein